MNTDHMELRAAVSSTGSALRDIQRYPTITISRVLLAELLAAYDALLHAGTKKIKAATYTPEFEEAWDAYPARPGNSKAAAFTAWNKRLKAGATPQQMIEGTIQYAAYCKIKGTEPEYVKQAATFFGPGEHFAADWTERRALVTIRRTVTPAQEPEADRAARRTRWGLPMDAVEDISHG